jgi:uncharacterized protein YecE (DUF72 family)
VPEASISVSTACFHWIRFPKKSPGAQTPRCGHLAAATIRIFLTPAISCSRCCPHSPKRSRGHTGPFIFEFQRTGIEPAAFLPRLDVFLSRLPHEFEYAVEIRNPAVLDRNTIPLPSSRELVILAVANQRRAYVLVNNRSEGNAPETVKALYVKLVGQDGEGE